MDFNCIYLYVGLKQAIIAANGGKKIFEQLKKCITLKLNSIGKIKTHTHTQTHEYTHTHTHIVRVLIKVGVFISMLI